MPARQFNTPSPAVPLLPVCNRAYFDHGWRMDWRTGHKQVPNAMLNHAPRNPLLVVSAFKVVGIRDMAAVEIDFHKLFF